MPIRNAKRPEGFHRKFGYGLGRVLQTRSGARFLRWTYESVPQGTKPHPVYTVGRDEIVDDEPWLKNPKLVAWRSLLKLGRDRVDAVELRADDLSLASVSKGRFGAATLETVRAASKFESADEGDQELRLVRVPSLYFVAIWLHDAENPDADRVLPLEEHPAGFKQGFPYSPKEVQAKLRPFAESIRDKDYGLDEAN